MKHRWTVAVDFDGVLHSYLSPWQRPHIIPDGPVPGALPWLWEMVQRFEVAIVSTRGRTFRGRLAMRRWLKHWSDGLWFDRFNLIPAEPHSSWMVREQESRGIRNVVVTATKVPALVYVDDRAYRFDGTNFPSVQEIYNLKPWTDPIKKPAATHPSSRGR